MMLVLFDIDGTLLVSQHAGTRAMLAAAREMFGETFTYDGVEIAGRIDPLIWATVAAANGIRDAEAHHDTFRASYAHHLARRLAAHDTVTLCPGVGALLDRLGSVDGLTLGLLTGNYRETGLLKIEAAGLDPALFPVAAWGCDGSSRRDLPPVAMARHADATGRPLTAEQVVIIGDTPHDVDCARTHGCRALAVATGPFSSEKLRESEPDLVVEDLSNTAAIVEWLLGPQPMVRR